MVNPVTGKRELGLVSQSEEIAIGQRQYLPSQQMQGGAYEVDSGLTAYVQKVGRRVAAHSGVPLPYEFVVLNNSVPNAWALPGGKIAINRGLLVELGSEAELAAVLGHEVAHAAARHGARSLERGMVLQGALVAAAIGTRHSEYSRTIVGSAQLGALLITQKYSRGAELEADEYGTRFMAQAGYDPSAAVSLQETFVRLSAGGNQDWISGLFASHPPSNERVERNRAHVVQLRTEGVAGDERGDETFADRLSYLREAMPAYELQDEARQALAEGRREEAADKIAAALKFEFKDPSLHATRGDVRYSQERYADAEANYDRAIERGSTYFSHFLGRGLARIGLNRTVAAQEDLEQSIELLPTAIAYNELGKIAEGRGDLDEALGYFEKAQGSQSRAGREAAARAMRIDLPRQPGKYVTAQVVMEQGRPLVAIQNRTQATMVDIVVQVDIAWTDGQKRRFDFNVVQLDPNSRSLRALPTREVEISSASAVTVSAGLK